MQTFLIYLNIVWEQSNKTQRCHHIVKTESDSAEESKVTKEDFTSIDSREPGDQKQEDKVGERATLGLVVEGAGDQDRVHDVPGG